MLGLFYKLYQSIGVLLFVGYILLSDLVLIDYFIINSTFLLIFLGLEFITKKRISFLLIWLGAFLFIINSEGILNYTELQLYGATATLASKLFIITNVVVIISYKVFEALFARKVKLIRQQSNIYIPKLNFKRILLIEIAYISLTLPITLTAYSSGRYNAFETSEVAQSLLYVIIIAPVGVLLPSYILMFFKDALPTRRVLYSLILSAPIFASLIIQGTRFLVLYSFVFYVINLIVINRKHKSTKYIILAAGLIFYTITSTMREVRVGGIENDIRETNEIGSVLKEIDINYFIANIGSPEGVILSNIKQINYFEENDFKYGLSSSYIFYFWVPRSFWPDKPTMLGHWLIRSIGEKGFAEGHSASFGYIGEVYSDFGLIGCLIASIFFGLALKKFDIITRWVMYNFEISRMWLFLLFPYAFFFIRSPVTASINLAAFIFVSMLFNYFLISKSGRI